MKSIKWNLFVTVKAALALTLASLVFTLAIQQQNIAAQEDRLIYNQHSHTQISGNGITGNEGTVLQGEIDGQTSHTNTNFNSNREDTSKCNSHSIPANSDIPPPIIC
jgi:hypothetical protein